MSDLLQNSGRLRQVKSWQSCHHWSLPLLNYCLVMEKNPWKSSKGLDWHGKQNSAPAKIMNHKLMAHSKKYSKWEELNACSSSFLQFMFDVLKETDRKILRKASSLLFSRAWRKDCLVVSNSIMLNLATKAATRLVRETWSHTAWFWTLTMPPRKNYHDKILAEYHLTDWFEKHFCYRNRPSMSNRSWKNNVTRRAFATRLYPHAERDSNASTYPNHPNPGELQIDPWNCCLWRGIGKAQIISDLYWCVHLPCALNGTQRHSTALNAIISPSQLCTFDQSIGGTGGWSLAIWTPNGRTMLYTRMNLDQRYQRIVKLSRKRPNHWEPRWNSRSASVSERSVAWSPGNAWPHHQVVGFVEHKQFQFQSFQTGFQTGAANIVWRRHRRHRRGYVWHVWLPPVGTNQGSFRLSLGMLRPSQA